jgi:hypothetical protein
MEWNKKTGVQDTLLGRKELDMIECLGEAKEYGRCPSDDPFFAVSSRWTMDFLRFVSLLPSNRVLRDRIE